VPKVVVYIPASAWKQMEERGLDPAQAVRDFAKAGYETVDSIEIRNDAGEVVRIPARQSAADERPFKGPDFK